MADGFKIAEAYVSIVPDLSDFEETLQAKLDAATDGKSAKVKVGVEVDTGDLAALDALIDEFGEKNVKATAGVNVDKGVEDLSALDALLNEFGEKSVHATAGLDDSRIVAGLDDLSLKLDRLNNTTFGVYVALQDGELKAGLDDINVRLDDIGGKDVNARVGLDDGDFTAKIDDDTAKLDNLGSKTARPNVSLDDDGFRKQVSEDEGLLSGLGGRGALIGGAIAGGLASAPAIPGALTGAASAVGTLGLAYEGISGALQAYSTSQSDATKATKSSGAAATESASQIHSAQEAVSNAETQAAHDAVTSAESVQSAEQQLQQAEYSEQQAQESLTQARQQAVLTLQQLNDASADAVLGAKQAQLDLEQARVNQEQTDSNAKSTALERAQAALSVQEAEQRLTEANQSQTNSTKAATEANKEGVNGLPAVVQAEHAAATAKQATANAQQSLADASRNAAWQQQSDAQRVSDAQYSLKAAYAEAGAGSTSATNDANAYAKALAALTPGGREMVQDITGLEGALKGLEGIADNAIAPGFTAFVKGLQDLLPEIQPEISEMGKIISGFLSDAGKEFASSGFQDELKSLFTEGNQFISILGPALEQLASAFVEMGAKSGGAVKGLADGLAGVLGGFSNLFKALTPFEGSIGSVLSSIGRAVSDLGGPLGSILGEATRLLAPLLQTALPLWATLLGNVVKAATPLVDELLPPLTAFLQAIGPPLDQLAGGLGTLAAGLVKAAGPLFTLGVTLADDLAPILPQLVTLFARLASDGISVLATGLTALLPPMISLVNDVFRALQPVMPEIVGAFTKIADSWTQEFANVLIAIAPSLEQIALSMAQMLITMTPLIGPLTTFGIQLSDLAIKVLPVLTPLIVTMFEAFADGAQSLPGIAIDGIEALRDLTSAFTDMIGVTVDGAAKAFGWLPGIGPKLKEAAGAFDGWRSNVSDDFDGVIGQMQTMQQQMTDNQTTSGQTSQQISQAFQNQKDAADRAQNSLSFYTQTIAQNGATSAQAQSARQKLIDDLTSAGLKSSTAKTDVDAYSGAVVKNGVNSTQAQKARETLIEDIFKANQNATQGQTDMNNLASAIQQHGDKSAAAEGARAQLIKDLEASGVQANTAKGLVDKLSTSISQIPTNVKVNLSENATGSWSISEANDPIAQNSLQSKLTEGGSLVKRAEGGLIDAGTGPKSDDVLAAVSRNEYVVQADAVDHYGVGFMDAVNAKKYADGGLIDDSYNGGDPSKMGSWLAGEYKTTKTKTEQDLEAAVVNAAIAKARAQAMAAEAGGGNTNYGTPAGGYSSASGGVPENYSAIVSYLVEHGFTKVEAAGIAGNIEEESGGEPGIWEAGGGGGYGLIQWTPPPAGLVGSGLDGELAQIVAEGKGMFNNPATPAQAAYQYLMGRERPADPGATAGAREASANAVYKKMNAFATGGVIPEPVVGIGMRSGDGYTFGERGPETVVPGVSGGGRGDVNVNVNYYGPQHPGPEQEQAMLMKISAAVCLAS